MPLSSSTAAARPLSDLVIPQRTPAGQAELSLRARGLSQRHRTVLFLVDGRRGLGEIQRLALQAGADGRCLEDLVAMELVRTAPVEPGSGDSSVLPSSLSLQGDSHWSVIDGQLSDGKTDRPLDEARSLLMRAVRSEAPVAGALTLLKLKRAGTREALEALLDEVELRLRKPHRQIIAAQTIRHVRHLLSLPTGTHPPAA